MSEWIFAAPLWLIILVVLVGGAVTFVGNRRLDKTLQNVGLAIAGLGLIIALLGYLVETPIEKTTRFTKVFVQSVVDKDETALKKIMSPRCSLTILGVETPYVNADEISAAAVQTATQYSLASAGISALAPTESANTVSLTFTVFSTQSPQPMRSDWTFDYEKIGDQWLLSRITCQQVGNLTAESIGKYLPPIHLPAAMGGSGNSGK